MTRAERIAEIIGYDNFLRAEAYYYDEAVENEEHDLNFIESINEVSFYGSFTWDATEEGYYFWHELNIKIWREL